LAARKKAYKSEADNILQEAKTLEWAYYQQFNTFDTTAALTSLTLIMPAGSHWQSPTCVSCNATMISLVMLGTVSPLSTSDSLWLTLAGDGSSMSGASF
jgi:hypothetical protein